MKFYVTFAKNQGGPGYRVVEADTEREARDMAFQKFGTAFAFIYHDVGDIHPLDLIDLDRIPT